MSPRELTDGLKSLALRLGFDDVGIAPAVAPPGYPDFLRWLEAGRAASMSYMTKQPANRAHPDSVLEGVRSVVVVSAVYGRNDPEKAPLLPTEGKVARYARGADYHRVFWDKLESMLASLKAFCPTARGRAVVDTAPLLERDFARLAGLGWIGKNTMLISRRLGSFTFLGALLVDIELAYDQAFEANHCGSCTRCLEACPTEAFVGPYELDSRRCISYWTIEHRGMMPDEQASQLDGWVFGCDICQDVCPWNHKAPPGRTTAFDARPEWTAPDLFDWLSYDEARWCELLKETAERRAKRTGLLRNAALVLGSRRLTEAINPLAARLADPAEDPLVRSAAAWALGQIGGGEATAIIEAHQHDPHDQVRQTIKRALKAAGRNTEEMPRNANVRE
jgi:epoxyqueuosine reductase